MAIKLKMTHNYKSDFREKPNKELTTIELNVTDNVKKWLIKRAAEESKISVFEFSVADVIKKLIFSERCKEIEIDFKTILNENSDEIKTAIEIK